MNRTHIIKFESIKALIVNSHLFVDPLDAAPVTASTLPRHPLYHPSFPPLTLASLDPFNPCRRQPVAWAPPSHRSLAHWVRFGSARVSSARRLRVRSCRSHWLSRYLLSADVEGLGQEHAIKAAGRPQFAGNPQRRAPDSDQQVAAHLGFQQCRFRFQFPDSVFSVECEKFC